MRKSICMALVFISLFTQGCVTNAEVIERKTDNKLAIESFENENVIKEWVVKNGGALGLSKEHYKSGDSVLRWDWQKSSKIIASNLKNLSEAGGSKNGSMTAWVYNEKPIKGKMTLNFGTKEEIEKANPKYTIDYNLDFTGWRSLSFTFRKHALNPKYVGKSKEQLEIMEITAPEGVNKGTTFFDGLKFSEDIPFNMTSDYQLPNLTPYIPDESDPWQAFYYYSTKKPTIPLEETITNEERQALKTISERYEKWIFGDEINLSLNPMKIRQDAFKKFIETGVKEYDKLKIYKSKEGYVLGTPLFADRSENGSKFCRNVFERVFLPVIYDYKINKNESSKEKALLLFDFVNDQGWAEGSAIETLDHETLRASAYFHGLYLMRNELKETGRLERELKTAHWYLHFGKTFEEYGKDYRETTADEMRTTMMNSLVYVLAMDDSPQKVQYMKGLLNWCNGALDIRSDLSDVIKPDYVGFHHGGVYGNSYAPYGLQIASLMTYLMRDTIYSISEESYKNLKNALISQRVVTQKYDVPLGITGRFPQNTAITNDILSAYAYMALSKEPIDKDMAEIFMDLWEPESSYLKNDLFPKCDTKSIQYINTLGDLELMLSLASKNYDKAKVPSGFWMKPYAGLAVQRRDNWLASIKGWSKYIWDFEAGKKNENLYGRYLSYGAIEILGGGSPVNTKDSGYDLQNGWNWSRWPGTTVINLPLDKLIYDKNHRCFTDQSFVGGVSCEGENGLFSMKLHDTVYNKTFWAQKSVFFFNNEIICLGSNISNDDKGNNTETTLFQCNMKSEDMPIYINSIKNISDFPYKKEVGKEEKVWLMDPYKNGYIIPDAKGLNLERSVQKSRDESDRKDTKGNYTTAWIDHGKAPKEAQYEYAILVNSTPEEVSKYAESPNYEVFQKDSSAHIVKHKKLNMMGYAIFDSDTNISHGIVKKVSVPAMLMTKTNLTGMTLSFSDPDLRIENNKGSLSNKASVVLSGCWGLKNNQDNIRIISSNKDQTVIEFDCNEGKTIEVQLIRE